MFKDNNKDTRTAPKVKHSHAGFCYNGLIPERGLPNIYDEAFLAKIVNDEPLTIFAKKSNHRCLTMSRIQLSLSLFLSLSLCLSQPISAKIIRDKIIGKLPAFSTRHFLSACIHTRTCLVLRNAYYTLLPLIC